MLVPPDRRPVHEVLAPVDLTHRLDLALDADVPIPFTLTDIARLHLFRRRIAPIVLTDDERAELEACALDDLRVEAAMDAWDRDHPEEAAFREAIEHDRWVECAIAMDA